jgi:hypothetical protein
METPEKEQLETKAAEPETETEEEYCCFCCQANKPKLTYATSRGHHWSYQTPSKKRSHNK